MVKVRFVMVALMLALLVLPESDGAPTLLTKAQLHKKIKLGGLVLGKGLKKDGFGGKGVIETPVVQPVVYQPVLPVVYHPVAVAAVPVIEEPSFKSKKAGFFDKIVGKLVAKKITG
ncbi:uncharacterized protein LOC125177836 [Hyalella azteca]|uniref:Uncharacterized protein LOC125177836 n=1 Tax=Hyalella azteca TaxID=294128 RepID=A0A979FH60_HYAAZ|nr:uncharacterized protein LOC125177836 [Hyalella azteca]